MRNEKKRSICPAALHRTIMILPAINQKIVILFTLSLFLLSFSWNIVNKTAIKPECGETTVIQEKITQNTTKIELMPQPKKEVLVLIWHWPWGYTFPLDRCYQDVGIPGCKMTTDRSLYSVADAVVMHHVEIMYNKNLLPQKPRPIFQYWVWANVEPPMIIQNLDILDNLFNMTMTFRQDSDVFVPYGQIETLKEPQNFTIPEKSKLVAWVVSKWYPGVRRIAYYEEFKKYISIDVYGKKHTKLDMDNLHSTLSQYKFYLAFENSEYKDYITEKLWTNAFTSWTVPVVLGTSRENYERFVPGDAFIHVDDFASPKELADYLLELDKDEEKYRKYFNWRSLYGVKLLTGWQHKYCQVCEVISRAPRYQTIHSVAKWFLNKS